MKETLAQWIRRRLEKSLEIDHLSGNCNRLQKLLTELEK